MVTYSRVQPDASPAFGCDVAILDNRKLLVEEFAEHLSENERATYARLLTQSRRDKWLAGRLAAKYLFLNSIAHFQESKPCSSKPTLARLSLESLRAFSPWLYRRIEVVAGDGGKPCLSWCGQPRTESISLSHSGDISCACLGIGVLTAVDIETIAPRLDAFYRQNFTAAERSWATCGIRSDWVFTLLWSLKESALKLGWPNEAAGVWDMPKLEIARLPALKQVGKFWSSRTISDDFTVFSASVKENFRSLPVRVAVNGTDNFVLSVMNLSREWSDEYNRDSPFNLRPQRQRL